MKTNLYWILISRLKQTHSEILLTGVTPVYSQIPPRRYSGAKGLTTAEYSLHSISVDRSEYKSIYRCDKQLVKCHWPFRSLTGLFVQFGDRWLTKSPFYHNHSFSLEQFHSHHFNEKKKISNVLNSMWITIANTVISVGFIPTLYHTAWPWPRVLLLRSKVGSGAHEGWLLESPQWTPSCKLLKHINVLISTQGNSRIHLLKA